MAARTRWSPVATPASPTPLPRADAGPAPPGRRAAWTLAVALGVCGFGLALFYIVDPTDWLDVNPDRENAVRVAGNFSALGFLIAELVLVLVAVRFSYPNVALRVAGQAARKRKLKWGDRQLPRHSLSPDPRKALAAIVASERDTTSATAEVDAWLSRPQALERVGRLAAERRASYRGFLLLWGILLTLLFVAALLGTFWLTQAVFEDQIRERVFDRSMDLLWTPVVAAWMGVAVPAGVLWLHRHYTVWGHAIAELDRLPRAPAGGISFKSG